MVETNRRKSALYGGVRTGSSRHQPGSAIALALWCGLWLNGPDFLLHGAHIGRGLLVPARLGYRQKQQSAWLPILLGMLSGRSDFRGSLHRPDIARLLLATTEILSQGNGEAFGTVWVRLRHGNLHNRRDDRGQPLRTTPFG
jgi:hypothetical protein